MNVSVIICAYTLDRWSDLLAVTAAVQNQSLSPAEVIVVIDHNPELLARAEQALAGVLVHPNKDERGLSGARNTGVQAAQGGVVAFVDEDALPEPDWLENLVSTYQLPEVVGVGGKIEPLWFKKRPDWFPEEFDWVVGCTYRGMPEGLAEVRNLIGANMSFRRQIFDGNNGFLKGIGRVGSYPAGGEETEFCIRLRQMRPDAVLLYQPEACVKHRVPVERASWSYFWRRCYAEGLSKVQVAQQVGTHDGLGSERSYVFHTLPKGILHNLSAVLHGELAGLSRSFAIVSGLLVTTAGYAIGKLRLRRTDGLRQPSRPATTGEALK